MSRQECGRCHCTYNTADSEAHTCEDVEAINDVGTRLDELEAKLDRVLAIVTKPDPFEEVENQLTGLPLADALTIRPPQGGRSVLWHLAIYGPGRSATAVEPSLPAAVATLLRLWARAADIAKAGTPPMSASPAELEIVAAHESGKSTPGSEAPSKKGPRRGRLPRRA